jgi:hypothetical protein
MLLLLLLLLLVVVVKVVVAGFHSYSVCHVVLVDIFKFIFLPSLFPIN